MGPGTLHSRTESPPWHSPLSPPPSQGGHEEDSSVGGREHPPEGECRHGVGICIITCLELGSHRKHGLG